MIKSLLKSFIVVWTVFLWLGWWMFWGWGQEWVHEWSIVYASGGNPTPTNQAQVDGDEESGFLETADLLMRFLSWAWIVPASLAWELMTNEVIYGKSFYLSEVLFKFWQFMRTLSLFALGFLVVYKVWESFVKWGDVSSLWSTAVKAIVAGALIPMSWWMIAAVIDLSLIATAAISALPLNAMEQLRTQLSLEGKISCSKTVYVKDFQVQPDTTHAPNNTQPLTFTDLIPAGDSMVFLWCGLLRMDQSLHLVNQEWAWVNKTADQISSTFIRLIMVVMLVIPMFILVVVNVIRIVFIRLWIVTVPFIILAYTFDIGGLKEMKYFKLWNIFGLIFQPVVVVGTLSVWVLIIMGMYGAMLGDEQTINQWMWEMMNVYVDSDRMARIWSDWPSETIINGDIFGMTGDLLWWWVGRMVVTFFMIFLFYGLIKIGFSTSELTASVSDSMMSFATQIASTAPIVPVPWFGMQSISNLSKAKEQFQRDNPFQNKVSYEWQAISNQVKKAFKLDAPEFDATDYSKLNSLANNAWLEMWKYLKKQQVDEKKPVYLDEKIKRNISEWVVKNRNDLTKKVFSGITFPNTLNEVMKLRDPANDTTNPEWKEFRKIVDWILREKISWDAVSEAELKNAWITKGTYWELQKIYK